MECKVSVSDTGGSEFEPSNIFKIRIFLSLNSANSVKTFRENSNTSGNHTIFGFCHDSVKALKDHLRMF